MGTFLLESGHFEFRLSGQGHEVRRYSAGQDRPGQPRLYKGDNSVTSFWLLDAVGGRTMLI